MGAEYQWIRKNTNYNSPVTDVTSTDIRCNVGANGTGTDIVTVSAGSTVKFTLDQAVYHQGPVAWYLGMAPGAASDWDGSGANWFKIAQEGPDFSTGSGGSATWPMFQEYSTTIPASIPSGE
jgi:plastocyanin